MAIDGLSSITQQSVAQGLVCVASTSFSAAASVSVDNCFTSAYENYRVMLYIVGSTSLSLGIRMRASAVDNSAASYAWGNSATRNTGAAVASGNSAQTSWIGMAMNTTISFAAMDFLQPQLVANTGLAATGYFVDPTSAYQLQMSGLHSVSTAYDGFSLIPSVGTITGTLRVYGYRNNV